MTFHQRTLREFALKASAASLGICCATPGYAQITQVGYDSLSGGQATTFAGVPGGAAPGTNYDNILIVNGVAFGERFAGQTVTANGNFDQIDGTPTSALSLLPGSAGNNLSVFQSPAGPVLSGNGTQGFPVNDAIGEGAISMLFSSDQSEFGLRLTGGNGGNAFVGFYRADGSLIQLLTLGSLPLISSYGFQRDGGVHDIRGVAFWNADVTGLGLAGIRYDVASAIPEPGSWAMMLLGFAGIGMAARRARRARVAVVA